MSSAPMLLGAALIMAAAQAADAGDDDQKTKSKDDYGKAHATKTTSADARYVFADDLMGATIGFSSGGEGADVEDAVVVGEKVKFVVLSTEDGDYVVPWGALRADLGDNGARASWSLNMSAKDLNTKGVAFDGDWSHFENDSWLDDVQASLGQAAHAAGRAVSKAADKTEDALDPNDETSDRKDVDVRRDEAKMKADARRDEAKMKTEHGKKAKNGHMRVSKILGTEVENAEGESLGDLEEMVVNAETGDIKYGAIGVGGLLDIGESRVLVPWKGFSWVINEGDSELRVNATEATLERFAYDDREFPKENEMDDARHLPVD